MRTKGESRAVARQRLIDSIYDAAVEPEQWPACLARLEAHLRVRSSMLFLQDTRNRAAEFAVYSGFDPSPMAEYHRHYVYQEPGFTWRQRQPEGTVSATNLLVSYDEFERTEYYNECIRPQGLHFTAGASLAKGGGRTATIGIQRRRRDGPFTRDDLRRLKALCTHLRRAFTISRAFAQAETHRRALEALLDGLPQAVLLVDGRGWITHWNARAEALLAQRDGLSLHRGRLAAAHPDAEQRLQALLCEASITGQGNGSAAGGAMAVPRPSGGPPYDVLVLPLRHAGLSAALGQAPVCGAVFVRDPGEAPEIDTGMLQVLFALTPAEARVVAALAQGRSPEEIAAAWDVSPYTVRTQLRMAYEKLGVHRQAELVQRVLSSPAVVAAVPDGNG